MFYNKKWLSVVVIFIILLTGCQSQVNTKVAPIRYVSPNKIYQRDSLYIATTIWQFIDKKVGIFDFFKQYKIPLHEVRIDVDSIIYSHDSLKLFAFTIVSIPDYESKIANKLYFDGMDMIGYRSSKKDLWSIWHFGQYSPSGYDNYNKVRNLFRWYYLGDGKFKNDNGTYWDGIHNDTLGMARSITFPKENNRVNIKFGYNIDNEYFWNSSIVWKKGNRIPGYYGFQTKGDVVPGYIDSPIRIIPHLDYPDSLLQLYK